MTTRAFYLRHQARLREEAAKYRREHRDKYLASKHKSYTNNAVTIRAAARAYRKEHPDKVRESRHRGQTATWRHDNPDRWQNHQRKSYERNLKFNYGLTCEDVARMYDWQEGRCRVCACSLLFDKHTHVDHDHVTGEFRGLLCHHCNVAVGNMREDPERAQRLFEYISRIDAKKMTR